MSLYVSGTGGPFLSVFRGLSRSGTGVTFMASLSSEPRHFAGQPDTLDWVNSLW